MADNPEEAIEEAGTEPEPGRPGGKRKLVFCVVGVALLIAAGTTGWLFLGSTPPSGDGDARELAAAASSDGSPGVRDGIDFNAELGIELPQVAASDEEAEEEEGAETQHLGKMFLFEPFVVNIADRDRDRFLKFKTELELSDDKVAAELDQRLPQIRDLIISLVGSKSFEEVRTIEGKNFLREEILLRVNSLLVTGKAKRVFFTEFVVQ